MSSLAFAHAQPVPFALLHLEHWMHLIFRKRDVVYSPAIEAIRGGILLGKGIVPLKRFRGDPLRLARLASVFNHDSHAVLAVVVGRIAHDPNTGMVHLDNCRDSRRSDLPFRFSVDRKSLLFEPLEERISDSL